MSYGFNKFVCIDHQRSVKMFLRSGTPRCPDCGLQMLAVGSWAKIPRRGDDKAWLALWRFAYSINQTDSQRWASYKLKSDASYGKHILRKIMAKIKGEPHGNHNR